ncbi:MAG: PAS domain-containing protein, partial [Spirochaetaceae bacterium]|nr:PAS domain-containing protein [Spirochaetaceae bacterium]
MKNRIEAITDTSILDLIPFSIFIKNLESVYIYSNAVNAGYSKLPPEKIPGKTDFDLYPDATARKFQENDKLVIESGIDSDRVVYSEIGDFIIRIFKRPYRNENGDIIGVMGVYWEITEELKNKKDLIDKQSQLRMALKTAEIGVWTWESNQKKLFWDEQMNRIFGISESNNGDMDYFINFSHPEDRKDIIEEFNSSEILKNGIDIEYRIVRPDGSIRYVRTQGEAHKDSDNNYKVIGLTHDITRKKLVEETLHSIVKLNQLVDGSSIDDVLKLILKEAVRLTDSQTGFLYLPNRETGTFFMKIRIDISAGKETISEKEEDAEILKTGILVECIKKSQPVIHNSFISGNKKAMQRELAIPIIEDGRIKAILRVGNKTGTYKNFDMDQLSLLGENLWNIITRKQMVHSLKEAHDEALKSNKIKDRFFSIIAHDLSNPISNIRILSDHFSTVISESSPDMDTLHELSQILNKSVITAQELLKNLLTWSRTQRNALEYQPESEIADIPVKMAIESCKPIAEGKNIEIISSCEQGLKVYADSNMLQTILRNLLVNAIKFSPAGEK